LSTVVGKLSRSAVTRILAVIALAAAMALTAVSPAAATTAKNVPGAGGQQPVSVVKVSGDKSAGDVFVQSACAITVYGYTGYRICEFDYFSYNWGGGNYEYFVVGTNYAIYHIWKGSGGWKSLGGQASRYAPNGTYPTTPTGVATYGTDENLWCRAWPWTSGWHRC
jgi:opacity protein-like surface antigen